MKVGNVSQTVLKRSVLKQLHTKRKEILTDLSVEEMCTAVQIRDTEDVVFASAVVSGNSKNIGVYAIMRARGVLYGYGSADRHCFCHIRDHFLRSLPVPLAQGAESRGKRGKLILYLCFDFLYNDPKATKWGLFIYEIYEINTLLLSVHSPYDRAFSSFRSLRCGRLAHRRIHLRRRRDPYGRRFRRDPL